MKILSSPTSQEQRKEIEYSLKLINLLAEPDQYYYPERDKAPLSFLDDRNQRKLNPLGHVINVSE